MQTSNLDIWFFKEQNKILDFIDRAPWQDRRWAKNRLKELKRTYKAAKKKMLLGSSLGQQTTTVVGPDAKVYTWQIQLLTLPYIHASKWWRRLRRSAFLLITGPKYTTSVLSMYQIAQCSQYTTEYIMKSAKQVNHSALYIALSKLKHEVINKVKYYVKVALRMRPWHTYWRHDNMC